MRICASSHILIKRPPKFTQVRNPLTFNLLVPACYFRSYTGLNEQAVAHSECVAATTIALRLCIFHLSQSQRHKFKFISTYLKTSFLPRSKNAVSPLRHLWQGAKNSRSERRYRTCTWPFPFVSMVQVPLV